MKNNVTQAKKPLITDKKVFYAGLIYFISIVLYLGARILWSTGVFNSMDPIFSDVLFSTIVQVVILAGFPIVMWMILNKQTFKQTTDHFFFKKVSFKTVLISLGLGVLMYFVVIYASSFWNTLIALFGYSPSTGTATTSLPVWAAFILTFITTSLMPGFCEETAHRGLLLGSMKGNGLKRAILLTALIFALAHMNVAQFGHAFVVGLVLGACTFISRSIFPAMIIHGTVNFCSIYTDYSSAYGWFGGNVLDNFSSFLANSNILVSFFVTFLILAVVLILTTILLSRLFIEQKRAKFASFKKNLYNAVKGTEHEQSIDFNNEVHLYALFNKASATDLKSKVESGEISIPHLERELGRNQINTMIYSELDSYHKPRAFDNIFIYITIFLMAFVTIATLIWGL